jgi:HNH endonuclease/AP2 domain
MRTLLLSNGKLSLVDDRDYDEAAKIKWQCGNGRSCYPVHSIKKNGRDCNIYLHHLIWNRHNNPLSEGMQIDHINRNRLDNRLENLRPCNNSQNHANMLRKKEHTSKFKGVCWRANRWQAQIRCNYKQHYLGRFNSEIDAAMAYDKAASQLFGRFALINFPENINDQGARVLFPTEPASQYGFPHSSAPRSPDAYHFLKIREVEPWDKNQKNTTEKPFG